MSNKMTMTDNNGNNTSNPRPILRLRREVDSAQVVAINSDEINKSNKINKSNAVQLAPEQQEEREVEQHKQSKEHKQQKPVGPVEPAGPVEPEKSAKSGRQLLSREQFKETLSYLREQYPNCFTQPPKLLALGIHHELMEAEEKKGGRDDASKLSRTMIRKFLQIYTRLGSYRALHQAGAERVDLFGAISGKVTAEEVLRIGLIYERVKQNAANRKSSGNI
jgi:hypothetical protein